MSDTMPYHWQVASIRDVCQKTALASPEKNPYKPFRYIDVSSVSNSSYRVVETKEVLGADAPSRARKLVHVGDVIFATVRPTLQRVALIPPELDGEICSTGFCVLRANPKDLDASFLYFYLLTEGVSKRVDALQKGATYPAINDADLLGYSIVLPPLQEQRSIASVLRAIQEAILIRRQNVALERERKAALMQHLFAHGTRDEPRKQTDIGEMPQSWSIVRMSELGHIQSGGTPLRNRLDYFGNEISWVKTLDLNEGLVKSTEESITNMGFQSIRGKLRPVNTVMVAMYGGAGTVGKTGILGVPATTNQAVCCIEPNPEKYDPYYLLHYLVLIRPLWMRLAIGTRKDPNISKGIIEQMQIPFPDLKQQHEIGEVLNSCDAKIASLRREVSLLEELFRAMLEELMAGRLSALAIARTAV